MSQLILIPVCFLAGWIFKRTRIFPENSASVFGNFIIYISLPSLILANLPSLHWKPSLGFLIGMPWLVFGMSIPLFYAAARIFRWSSDTRTAVILCCGLGNTSFVGLPVLRMFYGEEITPSVLIADQFGTFLCLSIPGFILAVLESPTEKKEPNRNWIASILKKLFTFPPFLALLFSFFLRLFTIPESLHSAFKILGETLVPIALFTVGFQLNFEHPSSKFTPKTESWISPLTLGLIYKLLFAPSFILLVYRFFDVQPDHLRVSVLEAGMAPMITASIVSLQMGYRPDLSAAFPGIGTILSIPTLTFLYFLLENFF
ncbi:AEC family transporter [Leptospira gomenensis]|uniref:AEC family transporter n=1 Tax=Leptospira gomenensis TaxID=2484974 RepID=A0A5F1Y691_9LEPT|nr:AEC family transporter [Leptospira gomenensis]TGK28211.1 AEC family transporter [Leptospira gomenensis]TGK36935.1 AEC family transporter [Leptospira gomenensis]TGK45572.1 AEC family transporter [Leptospira gomenensis]TGK59511.1 AEC family transporter [Leptospira gomenensis]